MVSVHIRRTQTNLLHDPTFRELKVAKQATRDTRSTHSVSKPSSMYESPPGISAIKKKDLDDRGLGGSACQLPNSSVTFITVCTVQQMSRMEK